MNIFGKFQGGQRSAHVSQNTDPVSQRTDWTPLKGGGTNFCTHKLVYISPTRYEFRASASAMSFYILVMLAGIATVLGSLYYTFYVTDDSVNSKLLGTIGMGCVFFLIGLATMISGTRPTVIDKEQNACWKGRQETNQQFRVSSEKFTPLESVYAFQLLPVRCKNDDNKTYYSYELNLVLHDGHRLNLTAHGNLSIIREQAVTLSDFLGRPLWDAVYLTDHYQPPRTEFTIS